MVRFARVLDRMRFKNPREADHKIFARFFSRGAACLLRLPPMCGDAARLWGRGVKLAEGGALFRPPGPVWVTALRSRLGLRGGWGFFVGQPMGRPG
jgi:hypothetical protein